MAKKIELLYKEQQICRTDYIGELGNENRTNRLNRK